MHLFSLSFTRSHTHSHTHAHTHLLPLGVNCIGVSSTRCQKVGARMKSEQQRFKIFTNFYFCPASLSLFHVYCNAVTVGHHVFNFFFWRKGYWNKKGVKHAARDHSSRMWLVPVVTAQVWIFFILVSVYRGKEFFELMPSSVKSIEMKKKRGSEKGVFTWMWLVQVVTAAAWRFQFGSFHRERFFSRSCRLK